MAPPTDEPPEQDVDTDVALAPPPQAEPTPPPSAPVGLGWKRIAAVVLATLVAVLGLRVAQLLSYAPLLADKELLPLGQLALELERGLLPQDFGFSDLARYGYMDHAQGTLYTVLGTVAFAQVLGANIWAMHATSMLAELVAIALLLILGLRHCPPVRAVVAVAPWVFAPAIAVSWQMMPFGNHTEFLWIPVAVALFVSGRPLGERSAMTWLIPLALLSVGLVLYRGNLLVLAAFVAGCLSARSWRAAALGTLTAAVSALLALAAIAWFLSHSDDAVPILEVFFPGFAQESSLAESMELLPTRFPNLPSLMGEGLQYLGVLLIGPVLLAIQAVGGDGTGGMGRPVRVFFILWAGAALVAPIVSNAMYPHYYLHPLYALVCCVIVAADGPAGRWTTRGAVILALGLGLAGSVDARLLVAPQAWETNRQYDGLSLWVDYGVRVIDADDVPYLLRIVAEGRPDPHFGVGIPTERHCGSSLRGAVGRLPHPTGGRCSCWSEGELAEVLQEWLRMNPGLQVEAVGQAAWIGCDRDMAAVESAAQGLPERTLDRILVGAREAAELFER